MIGGRSTGPIAVMAISSTVPPGTSASSKRLEVALNSIRPHLEPTDAAPDHRHRHDEHMHDAGHVLQAAPWSLQVAGRAKRLRTREPTAAIRSTSGGLRDHGSTHSSRRDAREDPDQTAPRFRHWQAIAAPLADLRQSSGAGLAVFGGSLPATYGVPASSRMRSRSSIGRTFSSAGITSTTRRLRLRPSAESFGSSGRCSP